MARDTELAERLRDEAGLLTGEATDYDALLALVGDARLVLIGEASHGTHDFYHERARITRRLIEERGFRAVAVEADWPDAHRVNCFVRGSGDDATALDALAGFERFPQWMWRNADVVEFVDWLRTRNIGLPDDDAAGFYGIDLYSLHQSIDAVLRYLERVDPEAARRARYRYRCFDHFGEDPQAYGYAASLRMSETCEREVVEQLTDLRRRATEQALQSGHGADAFFSAEQNARLVKNAEEYYRSMFRGRASSWNLRDCHMAETLDALVRHLERDGSPAKIVVWAHNSHLGDARATQMGRGGELNVGQLVRERYGRDAVLVGLTTFTGSVTAASDWGDPAERKLVRPALAGSYERLFHEVGLPRFYLPLRDARGAARELSAPRLERAIGVIYRPETERQSHYFQASLTAQFDAVLHFDETRALEPIERTAQWEAGEEAETYPSAL